MKNYGLTRSTIKPENIVVDEYSVWVHNNIREIEVTDETETRTEFEYELIQYTKDEYITTMIKDSQKHTSLIDYISMMTDVEIPEQEETENAQPEI